MAGAMKRVLHVEDDVSTQVYIKGLLRNEAEVFSSRSLEDALDQLQNNSFDLIILDFTLPDGSGQEIIQNIVPLIPRPAVIVLSGHELTTTMAGVDKVLTKGRYKEEDLIKLVHELLHPS